MAFLKTYAGVMVAFLVIDAVWIVPGAKPMDERTFGAMFREMPTSKPADS
jgi:uncharacterized membrane protein